MVNNQNMQRTATSYQANEVNTANRLKLLIMLNEGAIRFIKKADEALVKGDLAVKGETISKVLAIVGELKSTLDWSHAPALADQLERLYDFIMDRLYEANVKNDAQALHDALKIVEVLHSSWVELSKKTTAELAVNGQERAAAQVKQQNDSSYFHISV